MICRKGLLLTVALAPALFLAAQTKVQPSSHITGIDPRTGVVSARVDASGEDFQFTLSNPALLKTLRVGQGVFANFQTKQVSLDGKNVVGTILSLGPVTRARPFGPVDAAKPAGPADAARSTGAPAAQVLSVDSATGLVTGREMATGRTFQFRLNDSTQLKTLAPRRGLYINYKTRQVSLDGKTLNGTIVSFGPVGFTRPAGPVDAAKPAGPVDAAKPAGPVDAASTPAAQVVAIDSATGLGLGREKASGSIFRFRLNDPASLKSLAPGQGLYINYKTRQLSVDGQNAAGTIVAVGPPGKSFGEAQRAGAAGGGQSSAAQPLQSSGLVCSTKAAHRDKEVAQAVLIPSGATIYCRLGPLHSTAPITVQTSIPTVAQAPPTVTPGSTGRLLAQEKGLYADFQITTTPIPQTVSLTITATSAGTSTSTSVTLARVAIKDFYFDHATLLGVAGGKVRDTELFTDAALEVRLTAPADPDGLSIQVTGSDGSSTEVMIAGGATGAMVYPNARSVGVETLVTYSVLDPLDRSIKTVSIKIEPSLAYELWFMQGNGSVGSISAVPLNGKQLTVFAAFRGDPPADGTGLKVAYGGAPNLITGPTNVSPYYDGLAHGSVSFSVTVLPCGVPPPCQVGVTVGNSGRVARTAILNVNP